MNYYYDVDLPDNYYEGYRLDDDNYTWSLTDKQKDALNLGIYLVNYKVSIRKIAKEFNMPKSTVHERISYELRDISYELWCVCKKQLKINKQKYFK